MATARSAGLTLAAFLAATTQTTAGKADAEPHRDIQTLHYTPRDQQTGRYQHVPFEVPKGTTRLRIGLRFDKANGTNVVDLGLFEPGPLDIGTKSFRGWSGGERAEIEVGIDSATPGYWPGPIPAGTWHVMLGLYKVAEAGLDVELQMEVSTDATGPTPGLAARPSEPLRRGTAWYSGALHAHTHHSDGALPPAELARRARAEGLDFLAITDHNNTASQLDAIDAPGLLVITGEEITTPGGHLNAWGLSGARDVVDFRILPGDGRLGPLMDAARRRGVVFAINHPRSACVACSWTHEIPNGVTAIEVAHIQPEEMAQSLAMWDTLLRAGRRLVGIGTSDWHRGAAPIGAASVRVHADELSRRGILAGIEAGRVIVMSDAATPPPTLAVRAENREAQVGDTLTAIKGERLEVVVRPGAAAAYEGAKVDLVWRGEIVASATFAGGVPARFERFAMTPGYLRIHVTAADGRPLSLTNPVFIELKK